MKTIKVILWLLVLSFLGLLIYQNRQTLSINLPFSINIYFRPEVTMSYPVGNVMGFSAFVGFLVGSWVFFKLYWRKRRELKQCMASLKEISLMSDSSQKGVETGSQEGATVSSDDSSRS